MKYKKLNFYILTIIIIIMKNHVDKDNEINKNLIFTA